MTPVRVLGACGIVAAVLTTLGGALDQPALLAAAGFTMLLGNCHALLWGSKGSS